MKTSTILSSNNQLIIVDEISLNTLNRWSWRINRNGYAVRNTTSKQISIHEQIMGKRVGFEIDHINQNKLDNSAENLRFVTRSQNNLNRPVDPRNKTGHNGISKCKTGSYRVRISNKELGRYKTLEEAILARKKAVIDVFQSNPGT